MCFDQNTIVRKQYVSYVSKHISQFALSQGGILLSWTGSCVFKYIQNFHRKKTARGMQIPILVSH